MEDFGVYKAAANVIVALRGDCTDVISAIFDAARNKPFLRYHAQRYSQHPLNLVLKNVKKSFLKNVKLVYVKDIPFNTNIISSHVL